ncbi:FHA domain-containing protein FhaB/FipA [Janibacter sp. G1551]|uniref:FHA domain-containing protein FhaB/FipA n=1 Tax=Janibacter sp. G1551 TaxID=3420440 RepID=UPI003CFC701B
MSELTLTILRLAVLVLLWLFVFSVAGVLRGDMYGTRVQRRPAAPTARSEGRDRPARAARAKLPSQLVVTTGRMAGTTMRLKDSGTLIGRNPECALALDDDFASGRHARIYRDEAGWVLEDLDSTNGTFVGQQQIHGAVPVEAGTSIRIGQTVIELRK